MRTTDIYKHFLEQFTDSIPDSLLADLVELGRDLYWDPHNMKAYAVEKKLRVHSLGIYLGEAKGRFIPTPACIDRVANALPTFARAILDEKGAWMFQCGKDAFGRAVASGRPKKGALVLVQSPEKDIIGYGRWLIDALGEKASQVAIKHLADRGEYLRRER